MSHGIDADVQERLVEVESFLPDWQLQVDSVSKWTVGQQIEHILKATSAFTVMLLRNRSSDGDQDELPLKRLFMRKKMIPRGRIESPDVALPAPDTSQEALHSLLLKCRNRVSRLSEVSEDAVAMHPYLGEMRRDEIVEFLSIHLDHHLAIIRDIKNA